MAKAKKLTKEELQSVQGAVNNINNMYMAIGRALVSVLKNTDDLDVLEGALESEQKSLEEKYGSITINLTNGEYEESPQEPEAVE